MKKFSLMLLTGMLLFPLLFSACNDDDGYSLDGFVIDIATVNPLPQANYDLTLDNGQKLWVAATAIPGYRPQKTTRAMVNYTLLSDTIGDYDHYVKVNFLEPILTKPIVEMTAANADSIGNDPLLIDAMWIGDGYLNISFKMRAGGTGKPHMVNLVQDTESTDLNTLEFRQNAFGDNYGNLANGIVCFNLEKLVAENEGADSFNFIVKVNTFDGEKSYELTYKNNGMSSDTSNIPTMTSVVVE